MNPKAFVIVERRRKDGETTAILGTGTGRPLSSKIYAQRKANRLKELHPEFNYNVEPLTALNLDV
jgi:hypothetical protein